MDSDTSPYHNQLAAQQLLQGINTMQMQAGLMPGNGYAGGVSPMMPMPRPPTPVDFSNNIRLSFSSPHAAAFTPLSMPMPGGVTPVQHTSMPAFFSPPPMPGQFSYGLGMDARRRAADDVNSAMAFTQNMAGLGARAVGNLGAFALGGVPGMIGFEALGLGQSFSNFGSSMMNPFIHRRRQDLELQNASLQFVRGGQDLSAMGMGLSATAASRLRGGLHEMAGTMGFRANTYGMFNQSDVMKITRLAGQMGMLDQSQTADQIRGEVGKISRALANFIRIAEEPDMQRALGMMSGLRRMGYSTGEMTTAALQARHFARMAGTDVAGIMDAGMSGSAAYTARGLSGSAGMSAGMAAAGMANQLGALMSPNRLALAGGVEGITATLTEGAASTTTLGAILPALLAGGGPGGRLRVDRASVNDLMSGRLNLSDLMRRSGDRAQRFGAAGMGEIISRRAELQDELARTLTPEQNLLMPLILAQSARSMMPGMGLRERLMAVSGMDERGASEYTRMVRDPRFMENMMRQSNIRAREELNELARRSQSREDAASIPGWVRGLERSFEHLAHSMTRSADRIAISFTGGQDLREGIAAVGGVENVSRVIGSPSDYTGSALTRTRTRALLRDPRNAARISAINAELLESTEANIRAERENYGTFRGLRAATRIGGAALTLSGVGGLVAGSAATLGGVAAGAAANYGLGVAGDMYGSEGFVNPLGATPRSRFLAETVSQSEGLMTRAGSYFLGGVDYSPRELERRANEIVRLGVDIEGATTSRGRALDARRERARTGMSEIGLTGSRGSRIMQAAGRGYSRYISGLTGAFGHRTEATSESRMRQFMVEEAMSAGATREEAEALVTNEATRGEAFRIGAAGLGDQERAMHESIINEGGNVTRALTDEELANMAESTAGRADRVLESFGMEEGFLGLFGGASTEGRNAVGEFLGSAGGAEGIPREAMNIAFMEAALAAAPPGEERSRLQQELVGRIRESGLSEEVLERARAYVRERNIDTDSLRRVGESFTEDGTIEQAMNRLTRGETAMERVGLEQAAQGMVALFGSGAGSDLVRNAGNFEAQYSALRRRIMNGEAVGGITEEGRRAIEADRTGSGAGGTLVRRMIDASMALGRGGIEVRGGTGTGALAQAQVTGEGMEAFAAAMEGVDGFDVEELSAAGAGTEGAVTPTPGSFEEAVGVFGTASNALLQAANALRGRSDLNALNNTVT